tara:strand:+ start:113 stop:523 length:411 start_codon:yes stop_codon:yes gene_type:complete
MIKWYLSSVIMKIKVEDNNEFIVHNNLYLISSESDDEAYVKSLILGKKGETSYKNPLNKLVSITFEGLNDLEEVIDGDVIDGSELRYDEYVCSSDEDLLKFIVEKNDLDIFIKERIPNKVDYASNEVINLALIKKQ